MPPRRHVTRLQIGIIAAPAFVLLSLAPAVAADDDVAVGASWECYHHREDGGGHGQVHATGDGEVTIDPASTVGFVEAQVEYLTWNGAPRYWCDRYDCGAPIEHDCHGRETRYDHVQVYVVAGGHMVQVCYANTLALGLDDPPCTRETFAS